MIVACALAACLVPPPAPAVPPVSIEPVWLELADCESGEWIDGGADFVDGSATWDATAGIHEGGLQFAPGTWDGFRPDHFPAGAHEATPLQQVTVAREVLEAQGWGAWPVCSRLIGAR